jgi:hypothetical protein
MTYEVEVLKTRFWSATLPPKRLTARLNNRSSGGWQFSFPITAERRILLFFKRPAYYLIFQR